MDQSLTTKISIADDDIGHINNANQIFQPNHYYYFGNTSTEIIVQDKVT